MPKKAALRSQILKERVELPPAENIPLAAQVEKVEKSVKAKLKGKSYVMDLRVHSPASLNYFGLEGIDTAPAIVSLAKVKGLDLIAVTDFYSASFIDRVVAAAKDSPVTIIPGVDLRCTLGSCDDVILTCLFPETFSTNRVEEFMRELNIPPSAKGDEAYRLKQPFDRIIGAVEKNFGVVIPSRMDMTPYRMAVVPKLVDAYGFRAFDLAYPESNLFFKKNWPKVKFQLFTFSSANSLAQVGSRTAKVKMPISGFEGIRGLVSRAVAA